MIVWPSPLALASSWDEKLVKQQAMAMGKEFRLKGANVMLGPGLNVHRVSRGGRNFEYLPGEDPYLGARLVRPFVEAVQGEGVMCVLKHFGFNEQETNRNSVNSVVDDRTACLDPCVSIHFHGLSVGVQGFLGRRRPSMHFKGGFEGGNSTTSPSRQPWTLARELSCALTTR